MPEYVEAVETLCGDVVDFGILSMFWFEVYRNVKICARELERSNEFYLLYMKFVDFWISSKFYVEKLLI